jgi:hypothetical protein
LPVDFYEGRKTGEPGEKPRREPTTNSTHISPELGNQTLTTAVRGNALTAHTTHASHASHAFRIMSLPKFTFNALITKCTFNTKLIFNLWILLWNQQVIGVELDK